MSRTRLRLIALPVLLAAGLGATAAAANPAAEKCAAGLSTEGKFMYETVAPHVKADSDIEKLMRSRLRGPVMSGKLKLKVAEANGQAVGRCLVMLKG